MNAYCLAIGVEEPFRLRFSSLFHVQTKRVFAKVEDTKRVNDVE